MQGLKVEEIRSVPSGAEKCRNLLRLPDDEEFGEINPVFMRVWEIDKTDLTTN